MKVIIITLL